MKFKNPLSSGFTLLLVIFLLVGGVTALKLSSQERIQITVKSTDRITTGSGEDLTSKYLVFTEGEVFENSDAVWFGKFSSSDFQNKLTPGQTFDVKVIGWRIPFLSSYRNIIVIY